MKWYLVLFLLCFSFCAQKNYKAFVTDLSQKIKSAQFKSSAYNRLAYISDTFGPRLWGSQILQTVINEMYAMAKAQQFQNIRLEAVRNFTKWVRKSQSLTLLSPRRSKLNVIGLGRSVSGNVTGTAIVVSSFAELEKVKDKVPGNIVVFNNPWVNYTVSGEYRVNGGSIAAKYGAKAMLVRSVASDSISSVHTGYMVYDPQYKQIPCAAITTEDAEMFARMQQRGQTITLNLYLDNQFVEGANSSNLIFEIKGSSKPDEIILAGGHIDSWDTGSQTGANDDGGGFITVFEAFRMLKKLGYRPRRTLRFIAWSGEESGSERDGAAQYLQTHLSEINNHIAAFQNDLGDTKLLGFGHTGKGTTIVKFILSEYLSILNAGEYNENGYGADIQPLYEKGVPMFNNYVKDTPSQDYYFKYHHSAGDTMSVMNPEDMDSNVVGIAAFLYILADLEITVRNVEEEAKVPRKRGSLFRVRP